MACLAEVLLHQLLHFDWIKNEGMFVFGSPRSNSLGNLLQVVDFVQMCDELEQQLVCQLAVAEVQLC